VADPRQVDHDHPLLVALAPVLSRANAALVAPADVAATDVPLVWEGETIAGVRFPDPPGGGAPEAVGDLGRLLEDLATELGGPLGDLPRAAGGARGLHLPQVGGDRGRGAEGHPVHRLQLPQPRPGLSKDPLRPDPGARPELGGSGRIGFFHSRRGPAGGLRPVFNKLLT
jgi:hypothetical protein